MNKEECRACLRKVDEEDLRDLFREWNTPWALPGAQVADDLARLAHVEISEQDIFSKVICGECYHRLEDTCSFLIMVQKSDCAFRSHGYNQCNDTRRVWPETTPEVKGIGNIDINEGIEIKQEVLSDDEYTSNNMEQDWEPQLDIKIEPEEIIAPSFQINGTYSIDRNNETADETNTQYENEVFLDNTIKQEPLSDEETTLVPDLPLDCMLCMKAFHSVTSLKAHVISQHSYGAVSRKTDNTSSVRKEKDELVCATCRESFQTRTDLMVHETCHGQHACFVCGAKFNTFRQLSRHGARCRPRQPAAAAERTRPPVRSRQSNNKSNKKAGKVEPVPKQLHFEPSNDKTAKRTVKADDDLPINEDKLTSDEKKQRLSNDEAKSDEIRDQSINEDMNDKPPPQKIRKISTEIKTAKEEKSNKEIGEKSEEQVRDKQLNEERIDKHLVTDESSNQNTLMQRNNIKMEDLGSVERSIDEKKHIKATSPTLKSEKQSIQDLISFEEDSSHSSFKTEFTETSNLDPSEEISDQLTKTQILSRVTNMETNCDPEFSSQNMEVHLAINPLNKNTILLHDKMDIEQIESLLSEPLVKVISEISDENALQ